MKLRKPLKITGRTSAITNVFVQAIMPMIEPTDQERSHALSILGMAPDQMSCAYCGAASSDWDHLRPLVRNGRPTGYLTEIRNLVPSCAPCNQSKSGSDWRQWIKGNAKGSPHSRGISDIDERVARLDGYEKWGADAHRLTLDELVSAEILERHWKNLAEIKQMMREAQSHAEKVRAAIKSAIQHISLRDPVSQDQPPQKKNNQQNTTDVRDIEVSERA